MLLGSNSSVGCDPDWTMAKIPAINSAYGYHEFANVNRTWCVKLIELEGLGWDDMCVYEGAKRITFGDDQESFAAAFIDFLSQTTG